MRPLPPRSRGESEIRKNNNKRFYNNSVLSKLLKIFYSKKLQNKKVLIDRWLGPFHLAVWMAPALMKVATEQTASGLGQWSQTIVCLCESPVVPPAPTWVGVC